MDISVIIPLYNEEESLTELCDWISRVMQTHGFTYEVIMIDDGSKDNSWAVIQDISDKNSGIRGIRFTSNFGKSAALNSGFKHASGSVVITMDADLQDSPDEIPGLYKMIMEEGNDLVSGWKKKRHDPISKTIPSRFFNSVTRRMSGIKLHDFNCGLKAYRLDLVKNIDVYGEMHRYIPVIAKWRGYDKIAEMPVAHQARKYGVTKFGLERFIFGFLDLVSIMFVSKFRKRPMHFFGSLGTISFFLGSAITAWLIGEKVYHNWVIKEAVRPVTDQPLFFLALVALIIGVQLFLAGFLGELLSTQRRTKDYWVNEKIGL